MCLHPFSAVNWRSKKTSLEGSYKKSARVNVNLQENDYEIKPSFTARRKANEETESYHVDLEEFPGHGGQHSGMKENGRSGSFANTLKSIRTKSSKFGKFEKYNYLICAFVNLTSPIEDAKARIVEDLFMKNGYFQSNGEFSLKNSSQQDCYFKNMNEFVDDKLDMVVEKLAEKKSLNTVNNTLRCVVVKLEEETNVLLKENHSLTDKYNKEFDINTKMNEE